MEIIIQRILLSVQEQILVLVLMYYITALEIQLLLPVWLLVQDIISRLWNTTDLAMRPIIWMLAIQQQMQYQMDSLTASATSIAICTGTSTQLNAHGAADLCLVAGYRTKFYIWFCGHRIQLQQLLILLQVQARLPVQHNQQSLSVSILLPVVLHLEIYLLFAPVLHRLHLLRVRRQEELIPEQVWAQGTFNPATAGRDNYSYLSIFQRRMFPSDTCYCCQCCSFSHTWNIWWYLQRGFSSDIDRRFSIRRNIFRYRCKQWFIQPCCCRGNTYHNIYSHRFEQLFSFGYFFNHCACISDSNFQ